MSDGFNLQEALQEDSIDAAVRTFLGIQYEGKVCPDCNADCVETTVYDVHTAAFTEGQTPAYECPECQRRWYRESREELHATDMYDR